MRALRFACSVLVIAGGSLLACSLLDRSSDYFDSDGGLVVLANAAPGVPVDLVLTDSSVLYRVDDKIYRVAKSGGATTSIGGGPSIRRVVSDGVSRIAWIDNDGVHHWDEGAPGAMLDVDASAETIAVTHDRLLYTIAPANVDDAGRNVFIAGEGGEVMAQFAEATDNSIPVAASGGTFYFAFPARLDRETRPTDTGDIRAGDGGLSECPVAQYTHGFPPDEMVIDRNEGSLMALLVSGGHLRIVSSDDSCCSHSGCPQAPAAAAATDPRSIALYGGQVFHVVNGRLETFSFADLADANGFPTEASVIRPAFTEGPRELAVDGTYAYLLVGSQVQRVSILQTTK